MAAVVGAALVAVQLAVGDQVHQHVVLEHADVGRGQHFVDQRGLHGSAGGIGRMHDAAVAVAAFAREVQSPVFRRERHAQALQPADGIGCVFDHVARGIEVAQASACHQGVLHMVVKGIFLGHHGGNAALGPGAGPVVQGTFGQHRHAVVGARCSAAVRPARPLPTMTTSKCWMLTVMLRLNLFHDPEYLTALRNLAGSVRQPHINRRKGFGLGQLDQGFFGQLRMAMKVTTSTGTPWVGSNRSPNSTKRRLCKRLSTVLMCSRTDSSCRLMRWCCTSLARRRMSAQACCRSATVTWGRRASAVCPMDACT